MSAILFAPMSLVSPLLPSSLIAFEILRNLPVGLDRFWSQISSPGALTQSGIRSEWKVELQYSQPFTLPQRNSLTH